MKKSSLFIFALLLLVGLLFIDPAKTTMLERESHMLVSIGLTLKF